MAVTVQTSGNRELDRLEVEYQEWREWMCSTGRWPEEDPKTNDEFKRRIAETREGK